jgi:hypothetical protein
MVGSPVSVYSGREGLSLFFSSIINNGTGSMAIKQGDEIPWTFGVK